MFFFKEWGYGSTHMCAARASKATLTKRAKQINGLFEEGAHGVQNSRRELMALKIVLTTLPRSGVSRVRADEL